MNRGHLQALFYTRPQIHNLANLEKFPFLMILMGQ